MEDRHSAGTLATLFRAQRQRTRTMKRGGEGEPAGDPSALVPACAHATETNEPPQLPALRLPPIGGAEGGGEVAGATG
jgi:hypothetical protein